MIDPERHRMEVRAALRRQESLDGYHDECERVKTEYLRDLKARVTFPDLLADNPKMWTELIDMASPEFIFKEYCPEYIEFQRLLGIYQTDFNASQHEYNLFVSFLIIGVIVFTDDRASKWFLKGKPEEYYMERFEVDRSTALKMKSLRDKEIIIEPVWEKIK